MTQIVEGVHRLGTELVNFYLVEEGGRYTLVDAALPGYYDGLVQALQAQGSSLEDIDAVVLTHPHGDHIGLAERVRSEAGAPVHVHAEDAEMARTRKLPKRDGSFLPPLPPPTPPQPIAHFATNGGMRPSRVGEVSAYADGDVLDVPGRPRVIATPGHTPGHCALHFAQHGVVFTGDALCSRNPLTGREGPQIMPSAFNASTEQALSSLERLEGVGVSHLLFGHGDPWTQGPAAAVASARELGTS